MNKRTKIYIVIIAVVAVGLLLAYVYSSGIGNNQNLIAYDNVPLNVSTYLQLQAIATNQTLANQIGIGAAGNLPTKLTNRTFITVDGKPTVVYVGAEYCPFCGATRWAMILALMRFGDFSTLHYMTSSSSDVYPSTPTFTFYNSTYTSSYITFLSTETTTNAEQPLQTLTGISNATFTTYDTAGIPFIDFANVSVQSGSSYSPGLIYKLSWWQIIAQLNNPNSTVTQSIIGSADVFTAQICAIDNYTPSNVCSAPYISKILKQIQ